MPRSPASARKRLPRHRRRCAASSPHLTPEHDDSSRRAHSLLDCGTHSPRSVIARPGAKFGHIRHPIGSNVVNETPAPPEPGLGDYIAMLWRRLPLVIAVTSRGNRRSRRGAPHTDTDVRGVGRRRHSARHPQPVDDELARSGVVRRHADHPDGDRRHHGSAGPPAGGEAGRQLGADGSGVAAAEHECCAHRGRRFEAVGRREGGQRVRRRVLQRPQAGPADGDRCEPDAGRGATRRCQQATRAGRTARRVATGRPDPGRAGALPGPGDHAHRRVSPRCRANSTR